MNQSQITLSKSGTSFVGPDAVALFRAIQVKHALLLYIRCKMIVARGVTPTRLLESASQITHKVYRKRDYQGAVDDLQVWIDTMKAAMPVTVEAPQPPN